ncbi:DUF2284 domain-containing protein [Emergencia timonensis]|uniref:DUF2284 domain-containing protein n=1 Tax=Emergencia timonensis TaxID=1776384 RepID=UPI00399385D9
MTDYEILKVAAAAGIDKAAMVDADDLVFEYEFRKYCEMNNCGNYGKNYGCPPDCGTPAEMEQKARKYQKALVLQTIQPVKDITDASETGPLKKKHNAVVGRFMDQLAEAGIKGLPIMAGPCSQCKICGKAEGEPCRFPHRVASCLSAYGINVAKLCETCGIPWDYGVHKVGFFAIYMMGEI